MSKVDGDLVLVSRDEYSGDPLPPWLSSGGDAVQYFARRDLLAARFFQPDAYTPYQAAGYWIRFEYPFW